ncbi:MAG: DUF4249 domain-containing protein [Hymenobacteraceae bacterium]|nr:DUF4249 domain-containing protein [Hymenobacteraceae bacterium]
MKIAKHLIAVLAVLAFALQGCEKDVANFEINATPMLVTTAFISPQDTILTVTLQYTQPAIGRHRDEEELKVPDATVILSDGTKEVQLTYDAAWNKYFGPIEELPIVAGKTYFLKVTTPEGEKAEAACTVPLRDGVQVTELNYETAPHDSYGYQMLRHKITYKWQDAPGVENFYHLTAYRTYYIDFGYPPIRTAHHEMAYTDNEKIYVSDEKQDGRVMASPEFEFSSADPDHVPRPFNVVAVIAVTDEAYYRYHQSVINQESNGGNPFAEPQQIYGNVQGGLGVFAAYNQIKVQRVIQ